MQCVEYGRVGHAWQYAVVRHAVRVDENGDVAQLGCDALECCVDVLGVGDIALVADT